MLATDEIRDRIVKKTGGGRRPKAIPEIPVQTSDFGVTPGRLLATSGGRGARKARWPDFGVRRSVAALACVERSRTGYARSALGDVVALLATATPRRAG